MVMTMPGIYKRRTLTLTLFAALFWVNAGAVTTAPTSQQAIVAEKFIRTELYLGRDRKGSSEVTEGEFWLFIDEFVTPKFPKGLTVIDALGRWRGDGGILVSERSKVLVLIYPRKERRDADRKIEEIRAEYKRRFSQDSVLRLDQTKGISVLF